MSGSAHGVDAGSCFVHHEFGAHTGKTKLTPIEPYPITPPCGDGECMNGPPTTLGSREDGSLRRFETYALCEQCCEVAPDPYKHRVATVPSKWIPRTGANGKLLAPEVSINEQTKLRKRRAIVYLSTVCSMRIIAEDAELRDAKKRRTQQSQPSLSIPDQDSIMAYVIPNTVMFYHGKDTEFGIGIEHESLSGAKVVTTSTQDPSKDPWLVPLPHESEYKIVLNNKGQTDCDAILHMDGEIAGEFRVRAGQRFVIERPGRAFKGDSKRKFVFLKEKSDEAEDAGVDVGASKNGLIEVTFKPEKKKEIEELGISRGVRVPGQPKNRGGTGLFGASRGDSDPTYSAMGTISDCVPKSASYSSGATALGDKSAQRFVAADVLDELDEERVTKIAFRIVCDDSDSQRKKPRYEAIKQRPTDEVLTDVVVPARVD